MAAIRVRNRAALLSGLPERLAERRALALDLVERAIESVDATSSTERCLGEWGAERPTVDTIIAFGKASVGMAEVAAQIARPERGFVIAAHEHDRIAPLTSYVGGHPYPAPNASEHGAAVAQLARALGPRETCLVLVSGGGSSLLELPRAGITLDMIATTTRLLMAAGANILELNAVRSSLSQLKGGGLLKLLQPARVMNIVISDVVGAPAAFVASGPTFPPPRSPHPADVIDDYGLRQALPGSVLSALQEPPRSGLDAPPCRVAADNAMAIQAAQALAKTRGIELVEQPRPLSGIARVTGDRLISRWYSESRDTAFIAGGETTVEVRGRGRGGRCHELLAGCVPVYRTGLLVAFGTDGVDGSSGAAGALLDEHTLATAQRAGLDLQRVLADNDTARFFAATQSQIITGPTGTNVADVCIALP